ncbi:hypothetical protein [Kutzneria buriramensis]|uniref:Uncharacterized protein n=1 Tax=Kutzneria buriramensis TaxID=1045776 RepID=A0A3E0G634_9PSEU|nr:hypothetical protein [Kutzneria buriramensis]REH18065.1 hypothetical protein BCF44_13852 [Kutzneria buriramensis]
MSAPSTLDQAMWQPHRLLQAAALGELLVLPSEDRSWTKLGTLLHRPTDEIAPRLLADQERQMVWEMMATGTLIEPGQWRLTWCTWNGIVQMAHQISPSLDGQATLRRWNGYCPLPANGGLR